MATDADTARRRARTILRLVHWQKHLSPAGIAIWTVLVAVVGGLLSYHQWLETRRFEARKQFLDTRLKVYLEAIQVTSRLTEWELSPDSLTWKENSRRFWQMRWGELEMLGDLGIRNAARVVGEQVSAIENPVNKVTNRHSLRWSAECLANELRMSLENDWGIKTSRRVSAIRQLPVSELPAECNQDNKDPERPHAMKKPPPGRTEKVIE